MNIWTENVNLYRVEKQLVVLGRIITSIAVLTFIITSIIRPIDNWIKNHFAKIRVEIGINHQISQPILAVDLLSTIFTVIVTHRDRKTRHIQTPSIKPSGKITEEKYSVISKPKGSFLFGLDLGEQHTVEYETILNQLLVHLKESDKIRVKVSYTIGKK